MRRIYGAGGEDHFTLGIRALDHPAPLVFDRDSAAAVKEDAVYLRLDDHLKIGALLRRPQIGARGAGPPATAARLLTPADAVAGSGWQIVDVLAVFEPDLFASLDYCRAEGRPVHLRGKERTRPAANLALAALPVLGPFEERQDLVPAPAAVAQLRPMVEILRLAPDVDQPVDRAGAAEHAPARVQ